jgi:hypothetical protein
VRNPIEEAQALRGFLFFNFLGGSACVGDGQPDADADDDAPLPVEVRAGGGTDAQDDGSGPDGSRKPETIADQRLRDALMRAEMDGVTAPQEIHQLMATAANNIFAGSRAGKRLLRGWGAPFAMAESFNRRIAFISAFQIAEGWACDQEQDGIRQCLRRSPRTLSSRRRGSTTKATGMNVGRGAVGPYADDVQAVFHHVPGAAEASAAEAAGDHGRVLLLLPPLVVVCRESRTPKTCGTPLANGSGSPRNSKRSLRNTLTEFGRDAIADVVDERRC